MGLVFNSIEETSHFIPIIINTTNLFTCDAHSSVDKLRVERDDGGHD